jgi:hypothetical protein
VAWSLLGVSGALFGSEALLICDSWEWMGFRGRGRMTLSAAPSETSAEVEAMIMAWQRGKRNRRMSTSASLFSIWPRRVRLQLRRTIWVWQWFFVNLTMPLAEEEGQWIRVECGMDRLRRTRQLEPIN